MNYYQIIAFLKSKKKNLWVSVQSNGETKGGI